MPYIEKWLIDLGLEYEGGFNAELCIVSMAAGIVTSPAECCSRGFLCVIVLP
jgi:hypothetical protein